MMEESRQALWGEIPALAPRRSITEHLLWARPRPRAEGVAGHRTRSNLHGTRAGEDGPVQRHTERWEEV